VAPSADIYVGKVLSDRGRGNDGAVLSALDWAIANRCRIVSMSLGTATRRGDPFSQVYEAVGQRALAANTLIIAAAGNESERPGVINPVGHPANCPSIMAVGAIDVHMQIASFSTRGFDGDGGRIDIVGPGVNVYSTVPMPGQHARKSGTSMACPHVAGIAALYAEAKPGASARELWQLLVSNAKRLDLDAADVGAGLAQAPV
jgi:subtilisin family serine protease